MDTFTPDERSEIMARIRSQGTSPERRLLELTRHVVGRRRKLLLNASEYVGKPDVVIPSLGLILFADGCFFHGCAQHCRMPSTNRPYWERKIANNQRRDRRASRVLRQSGHSVWRFWEHDLKPARWEFAVRRLRLAVQRAQA